MSNITLNIVEPGSTPVDPVVPNTGLFISGIGGAETAIIATVGLVAILAIIGAIIYRKKKVGKGSATSLLTKCKQAIKSKKHASGLAVLALLVSIGTVAGLLKLGASAVDDGLTVTTSSTDFTIEVGDEPVFAVLPVELTVAEATQAGYTLTAYTEDTNLVSTTDSSKVIPMVVADEGELTTLTDNTYGLALVEPEGKDSEVYTTLSTEADTPTLITDKDYKATEANDTTTIYYGFYITPDIPKGTYTGSNINYEAQPNHITTLSFNGNGSDGGVDMEGMTLLAGDTITLPQNTYTKEGYTFTGWNTVATPTTEDPGIVYADEADFTASTTQSEDITLYAQWKALPVIGDLTEMQDFAKLSAEDKASVLASMTSGQQYQLKDNRDQTVYYIAKLADGNVWMTQNLDFDIVNGGADLNSTNTDVPVDWVDAGSLANTYNDSTWNFSNTTPESSNLGMLYWNGIMITNQAICEEYGGTWYGEYCDEAEPISSTGNEHYSLGNYYNWTAAVAMSNSSSYTVDGTDVNQSICPAGWRLPIYSGNKSFSSLIAAANFVAGPSGNIYTNPNYFAYGGRYSDGLHGVGIRGDYWSSVVYNSQGSYDFYFSFNGDLGPQYYYNRDIGHSVRCVVR